MNKQRYLAELGQLLIFMTSADRALTLEKFGDLFDQAGPGGAEALAGRIGSPTKNAIRLSRSYMPGCLTDEILFQGMDLDMPAPEPEPVEEPEPEEEAEEPAEPHYAGPEMPDLTDMPDLPDLPDAPAAETSDKEPEPDEAEGDEGPEKASAPAPVPADKGRFVAVPIHEEPHGEEEPEEEDEPPRRPEPRVVRPMSPWVGAPLFILSILVLGLPLAALVLVLIPVLLAPGALVLGGAVLAAIGGLWCISYVADAALMFGLAAFILGLALLVLWCGFALDVGLVKLWIRAITGLKHVFLGRSVR